LCVFAINCVFYFFIRYYNIYKKCNRTLAGFNDSDTYPETYEENKEKLSHLQEKYSDLQRSLQYYEEQHTIHLQQLQQCTDLQQQVIVLQHEKEENDLIQQIQLKKIDENYQNQLQPLQHQLQQLQQMSQRITHLISNTQPTQQRNDDRKELMKEVVKLNRECQCIFVAKLLIGLGLNHSSPYSGLLGVSYWNQGIYSEVFGKFTDCRFEDILGIVLNKKKS
jgi:hypothetical protein